MTIKELREALREVGMTVRVVHGEHRINYKGGSEETAYYTTDRRDALGTGLVMSTGYVPPCNIRPN